MHRPVMSKEIIKYLDLKPGDVVLDCTVGAGGHSLDILEKIMPSGRLIGIDQDEDSLKIAKERLNAYGENCDLVYSNFQDLDVILSDFKINKVDAILYDLGTSSCQLDNPERGFSFMKDGPLDMRMDKQGRITAFDLVNHLSKEEIMKIIWTYGEERYGRRIASFITERRKKELISTTRQLKDIVIEAIPFKGRRERIHPATRTFQAFRIVVNNELEALKVSLKKAINFLNIKSKISVLSFHSLEDRIVKNIFRDLKREHVLEILTKKPIRPTRQEVRDNPRARSARLRVAAKDGGEI